MKVSKQRDMLVPTQLTTLRRFAKHGWHDGGITPVQSSMSRKHCPYNGRVPPDYSPEEACKQLIESRSLHYIVFPFWGLPSLFKGIPSQISSRKCPVPL
eukprot:scaffold22664_cov125-Cylindrotheca_fusiformis.AAC.2